MSDPLLGLLPSNLALLLNTRRRAALGAVTLDASASERLPSFAFPSLCNGCICFRAISDQSDVGISGALHTGLGFFGLPTAVPPDPPCGEVCPDARSGPRWQLFHVP